GGEEVSQEGGSEESQEGRQEEREEGGQEVRQEGREEDGQKGGQEGGAEGRSQEGRQADHRAPHPGAGARACVRGSAFGRCRGLQRRIPLRHHRYLSAPTSRVTQCPGWSRAFACAESATG